MSTRESRTGCPHCGEKEDLVREAVFDRYEDIVICQYCGWSGSESDLLTDAEARIEGKLHRMDL